MPGPTTTGHLALNGKKDDVYYPEVARLRAENATRVPCGHCGVLILPANLERHESLHAD